MLKKLLEKKNLKVIAPSVASLVVAIGGIIGYQSNPEEVEILVVAGGGLIGTLLGIFANSDKKEE